MSPKPSENGMEGDDEREEESDEENSEAEVGEEEEEDEPRLKYQRMGGSVPTLLQADAASCIAVAERMIALGTHTGSVHILDFLGNQVSSLLFFYLVLIGLCILTGATYRDVFAQNWRVYDDHE